MSRILSRIPLALVCAAVLPATASAHTCANDQTARVRIFKLDGVFRACLRGYPSHRLGAVRPAQHRVRGTMLAYVTRVKGDDFIGALDLSDGDRWLRSRAAGGLVISYRLRAVGALLWGTDTGGVFVADLEERRKVDQLHRPATRLRITKRQTEGDICGAEYAYTFHWRANGLPRSFVWNAFEGSGCG